MPRRSDKPGKPITPRMCEILDLVAVGMSGKQIAWDLGICESTVKNLLISARTRLSARNTAHAVAIYVRQQQIPLHAEEALDA
jgi:DNA-binding NarL/FixJ family response regulator